MSWLAVGLGAALGAWLRWGLGLMLNALHPQLPVGTISANLAGGYLIGIAVAFFSAYPHLSPDWRLFAITGFLGGLTTFGSTSGTINGNVTGLSAADIVNLNEGELYVNIHSSTFGGG